MALGFIRKVFSFGRKDLAGTGVADAPLSPHDDEAKAAEVSAPPVAEGPEPAAPEPAPTEPAPTEPAASGPAASGPAASEPTVEVPPPAIAAPGPDNAAAPGPADPAPPGPADVAAPSLPAAAGTPAEPAIPANDGETPAPRRVAVTKTVAELAEPVVEPPAPRRTWFQRLRDGLSRSSRELTGAVSGVFTRRKLDDATLEELEEVLIRADLGAETAIRITGALAEGRFGRDISDAEVRGVMAGEIEKVLAPVARPLELDLAHRPHVILVVGVNGTGKTTTIGKLAAKLSQGGLKVMLAAGDTFRAAAIEQLHIWGERTGSTVISNKLGADAAGLAFDAYEKAKDAEADVLIVDTAGRLQNRAELMAELEKIVRVLGRLDPDAPHTVLQTLDATTGQNALNQVEIFRNVAGVNGLVMTKLDGTARGGILVAIAARHRLPVYFIGVGEGIDDLEPFAARDFAEAIAGVGV